MKRRFGNVTITLSFLIFSACTNSTPSVGMLRALDEFEFSQNFVTSADLSTISLQASCSKFITGVDVSFDGGTTWTTSSTYDSSSRVDCGNSGFALTLSNTKSPWSTMNFVSGQTTVVKFRAMSRAGYYVYRDISVKYTPSANIKQEMLVGSIEKSTDAAQTMILRSRLRAQKQDVATGTGYRIYGRILK